MKRYVRYIIIVSVVCITVYVLLNLRYNHTSFILVYHKINTYQGKGLRSLYVNPRTFNNQMNYLYRRGYRTIPLSELVDIISHKKPIPKKVFVLTFDDGYEDNYINAYGILKKYNFRGTIFLTAGYIGKEFSYPGQPPEKHLNIEQIKMAKDVYDYGSHTVSHPNLTKLTEEEIIYEITESKKIIQRITNQPINLFCYPFGEFGDDTIIRQLLIKTGYIGACTTNPGLVSYRTDVYRLPRYEFKEIQSMSIHDFIKNIDFYLRTFSGL